MRHSLIVPLLVCLLFVPRARGDVLPPEVAECRHRRVGESCGPGVCEKGRCSRLDYSGWDRAAHSSPPIIEYECLRCSAETPRPYANLPGEHSGSAADGGSERVRGNSNSEDDDGVGQDEGAEQEDVASSPSSDPRNEDKKSGGCVVAPARLGAHAAALTFAGVFGWLVSRRRRGR